MSTCITLDETFFTCIDIKIYGQHAIQCFIFVHFKNCTFISLLNPILSLKKPNDYYDMLISTLFN